MPLFPWTEERPEDQFLITRPKFKTRAVSANTDMPATELHAAPPHRVEPRVGKGTPADKAADPDLGYDRIPAERYTSPAFMGREWKGLWSRSWLMACRESDIAQPGDHVLFEIGHESILIVRQWDDSIRAFFNVCRHRGEPIVERTPEAVTTQNTASFRCPFHHWEWSIDGQLKNVPDAETFPQGVPSDALGLKTVRHDTWAGWVFINLNPHGESLRDFLENLPDHLACYQWEALVHTMDKTIEWPCNWKAALDCFTETYRMKALHPQVLPWTEDYHVQIDTYGRHSRMLVPFYQPATRHPDQVNIAPETARQLSALGIHPRNFDNRPAAARRAIQKARREMENSATHLPYRFLNDEQLSDNYQYTIFPNIVADIFADHVLIKRLRPHPTDPNKCFCDVQALAYQDPARPIERAPYSAHGFGDVSLGPIIDKDAEMLAALQKNMHSMSFEGPYLGDQERRIRHFHAVLMAYLGEAPSVGPARAGEPVFR